MNRGDILPGLGLLLMTVGVLTGLLGIVVAGNSADKVEVEGEIIDKIAFLGGRKDIVLRMDDGSIEREAWADDDLWYNYEVGDRMPIEIFVEDREERTHGLRVLILGGGTALTGYIFLLVASNRRFIR